MAASNNKSDKQYRSEIWNFFSKSVDTDNVTYASCNICKNKLKCSFGSTSSLRSHLSTMHFSAFKQLSEKESLKRKEQDHMKQVGFWKLVCFYCFLWSKVWDEYKYKIMRLIDKKCSVFIILFLLKCYSYWKKYILRCSEG